MILRVPSSPSLVVIPENIYYKTPNGKPIVYFKNYVAATINSR